MYIYVYPFRDINHIIFLKTPFNNIMQFKVVLNFCTLFEACIIYSSYKWSPKIICVDYLYSVKCCIVIVFVFKLKYMYYYFKLEFISSICAHCSFKWNVKSFTISYVFANNKYNVFSSIHARNFGSIHLVGSIKTTWL